MQDAQGQREVDPAEHAVARPACDIRLAPEDDALRDQSASSLRICASCRGSQTACQGALTSTNLALSAAKRCGKTDLQQCLQPGQVLGKLWPARPDIWGSEIAATRKMAQLKMLTAQSAPTN